MVVAVVVVFMSLLLFQVWFSAQRLKHGVSWTPEEVEEARRKQFNGTVHTVPQTITVIPAHHLSAAANGLQSILQTCQIVGQSGLVFTQVEKGLMPVCPHRGTSGMKRWGNVLIFIE